LPWFDVVLLTKSVGSCVAILLVWRIVSLVRHMGFCIESSAGILAVVHGGSRGSASYGAAVRSATSPVIMDLRHSPTCVGIHQ
jgi:hypothetical protein